MKPLTQHQIKIQQLLLLQIQGYSLRDFANHSSTKTIFNISQPQQIPQLKKITADRIKSIKTNPNSSIQAFTWALFETIFQKEVMQDVLYILKSTILSQQLERIEVQNLKKSSLASLEWQQMKKFLVEFIFQLNYSTLENKIEVKFNKNPIALDILTVLFRKLLVTFQVQNAHNFNQTVPPTQAIQVLVDYFDLNCKHAGHLFLFYQDSIFICTKNQKEVMFGRYVQYSQKKRCKTENTKDVDQQEATIIPRRLVHDNRSLQKIATTQSVIIQADADTPSFNYDESQTSFRSSKISQTQNSDQIIIIAKSNIGNESPLKSNDIRRRMRQSKSNFDSAIITPQRLKLEQQLKQSLQKNIFQKIMDTPQTAPNRGTSQSFDFLLKRSQKQPLKKQLMRKSKSLKLDDSDYDFSVCNQSKNSIENQLVSQSDCSNQQNDKRARINMDLNIYDINICINQRRGTFNQRFQTRMISKGLNGQIYCRSLEPCSSFCSPVKYVPSSPKQFSFKKKSESKLLLEGSEVRRNECSWK